MESPVETVHLQIPVRAQSLVIGRGRRVITQVVEECQVEISVPTQTEHSSVVTITGAPEMVREAQNRVEAILGYKLGSEDLTLGFLNVPKSEHSALIGLNGSLVKELRKTCGCHIHVPRFKEKHSNVEVYGSAEAILEAKREVERVLGHEVTVTYPPPEATPYPAPEVTAEAPKSIIRKRKLDKGKINEVVFFPLPNSDRDDVFDRIVLYISSATSRVDACVAALDEPRIVDAIEQLLEEGVEVRIIICKTAPEFSLNKVNLLQEKGAIVAIDKAAVKSLINFVVVDNTLVMNGSHTWTKKGSLGVRFQLSMTNHRDFVRVFQEKFEALYSIAVGLY